MSTVEPLALYDNDTDNRSCPAPPSLFVGLPFIIWLEHASAAVPTQSLSPSYGVMYTASSQAVHGRTGVVTWAQRQC